VGQHGRIVVLVDDDPMVTAMYRLGLEQAGYDVTTCIDGNELAALLEDQVPDVVVLDWSMPGADGGDVLESLRRDSRTRDLKVVILSAIGRPDHEAERAAKAGAIAWLDKAHTHPAKLAEEIGLLFRD
jgi:CheY-like chemotaxis protein